MAAVVGLFDRLSVAAFVTGLIVEKW